MNLLFVGQLLSTVLSFSDPDSRGLLKVLLS